MPLYRAVSDHAASGTVAGQTYEVEPGDVRVRAGVLVPVPVATAPVTPEREPPAKPKRRRG